MPGQRVELDERARVEQLLDPLAGGFLPLACCFSTARCRAGVHRLVARASKSASLPAVVFGSSSGAVPGISSSAAAVTARHPLVVVQPVEARPSSYLSQVTSPDSAHREDQSGDPRHWRDDLLQAALDAAGDGSWGPVVVLASTGSTNADAAEQVREGAPEGFTVVADEQTIGRGRLDRSWHSPPGAGLAMSVVLRPVAPEPSWGWIPLLSGLAVVEALESQGASCALKWPNDIVVDGDARDGSGGPRKLGGLLVERVEGALVVGIGVNVDLRADEVPVARATSTVLEGVAVRRERLVVDVLGAMRRHYLLWHSRPGTPGRGGLADAYAGRCLTLGRQVRALLPGDRVEEGTAYALDGDGRLLLRRADGTTVPVSAGDLEHLR